MELFDVNTVVAVLFAFLVWQQLQMNRIEKQNRDLDKRMKDLEKK